jgi:hypothetical protein
MDEEKAFFICLLEHDGKIYLMLDDDRLIRGWNYAHEAVNFWEDGWRHGLEMGQGFAAGAMLGFMQWHPSIVYAESLEWLTEHIISETESQVLRLGSPGNRYLVASTLPEAKQWWEEGAKPSLTS